MKRILSLFLCIAIMSGFVVFANEDEILLYESYNEYATNSSDTSLEQRGDPNIRVIEDGKRNKAYLIPTNAVGNVLSCELSDEPKQFGISVKLKYEGSAASLKFSFSDNGNQEFVPFSVNSNGKIVLQSGKVVGAVQKGTYTKVDVAYNSAIKRCYVRINGRESVSDHLITAEFTQPKKLIVRTFVGGDGSAVIMDDLTIYKGLELSKKPRAALYNEASIDYTPVDMANRAPLVMVNNNFDTKARVFNGLAAYNKENVIEYMRYSEDNGCILMDKTLDNTDPFIDVDVAGADSVMNFVMEIDISSDKLGSTLYLFNVRNDSTGWGQTFRVTPSGDIYTYLGKSVGKISKGEFVKLAAVYKTQTNVFDVYVNKEKVMENVPISVKSFGKLTAIRIQQMPKQGNGRFIFDNFKVYEGTEPYTLSENTEDTYSVLPNDSDDIARLSGVTAFHEHGRYLFSKNKKEDIGVYPYYSGNTLMVSSDVVKKGLNVDVKFDDATGNVTLGDIAQMKLGEKSAVVGKEQLVLENAPEIKDNTLYLPIKSVAVNILKKQYFSNYYGIVVISDKPFKYEKDNSVLKQLSTYLFFMRPDGDKIMELYEKSKYKNVHPRILATKEDFDRIKSLSATDKRISEWTKNVIKKADSYLGVEPQGLHYEDGAMLEVAHSIGDRLLSLCFAWKITGDKRYAERAWREMKNAAEYPDWNPKHFLDTGEMTYIMGLAYDWCYDFLDAEQKKVIYDAIAEHGLEAGRAQYQGKAQGTDFVMQSMNWNSVCNGGLITGACAIMDEAPIQAKYTIVNGLRSFEYMITEFAPDGAWVEGVGYWEYTVKFMSFMVDSMNTTLGTDFDIPKFSGIDRTAEFIFGLTGNTGYNNFHDAGTESDLSKWLLWLGKHYNDAAASKTYLSLFDTKGVNGDVYDCLYYNPELVQSNAEEYSLDCTTKITESGSMRSSWSDNNGMWLGYSGGGNTVNHYHLDEGSFVLDMFGERWAVDMGGDMLSYLSSFHGERYDLFRIRPESHNTLIINPDEGPGQELSAYCPITEAKSKPRGAIQTLDLTSAYANQVSSAVRGFMLTDDRRTAIIRDELNLLEQSDVYWLMHTSAEVEIVSSDTAILTKNGKRMQVKMYAENATAEFTDTAVKPFENSPKVEGQVDNSSFRRVGIKLTGQGEVSISVRITPADEYTSELPFNCGKISDWTIPDGEISGMPFAKGVYVDGKLIHNFSERKNAYTLKLANNASVIPQITVDPGEFTLESISTAANVGESTIYKLSQPDGKYTKVAVKIERLGTLENVEGRKRYVPIELYASANPEIFNSDKNANDGNQDTNWAANNKQTLTYDFGDAVEISAFALSTMKAETRSYNFEIEVSNDAKTWTNVYTGATTAGKVGYELFEINPVKASYIRYLGKGNSENSWNSIKEFAVLGGKE